MKVTATSADALVRKSNIISIRLINKVMKEVCAALPQTLIAFTEVSGLCDRYRAGYEYSFSFLSASPAVGEWQEGGCQLLSFTTSHLEKFQAMGKKQSSKSVSKF